MLSGFENIGRVPELKRRLLWSLGLLAVYRIGIAVPTPGVDGTALRTFFEAQQGTIFGLFNLFSGGALEGFSVFALGIMPYISSSIIFQLLAVVVPALEKLQKEGEQGRRKITQYTRYGTIGLSIIQGIGIAVWLEGMEVQAGTSIVIEKGWDFRLMTVITLTAGTAFLMWLGEQITERGIGNGISLLIFAGIVAAIPSALGSLFQIVTETRDISPIMLVFMALVMAGVVYGIVFFERSQRRVPIQYAKRVVGRKMMGGQSTHLPLKLNVSGVIPPIFASSLLMFPLTIVNFLPPEWQEIPWVSRFIASLTGQGFWYNALYVVMIVFFCYFYAAIQFDPTKVADDLRKYGGYIPGIRPGKNTADYLNRILGRLTAVGAIYLSAVCVLPSAMSAQMNVPFYFGGTGLLIVVGVAMDTVAQMETHLITRNYDGFIGGGSSGGSGRFRGRGR